MKVDQSVFEYDEVWDGMKAAQRSVEKAKEQEAAERKVRIRASLAVYPRALRQVHISRPSI
jgi:hypothetical protein